MPQIREDRLIAEAYIRVTEDVNQIPDNYMVWHLMYGEDPHMDNVSFKQLVTTPGVFYIDGDEQSDEDYNNPVKCFTMWFEMTPERAYTILRAGEAISFNTVKAEDIEHWYRGSYGSQHGPELHIIADDRNKLKQVFIDKMVEYEYYKFKNNMLSRLQMQAMGGQWNEDLIRDRYSNVFDHNIMVNGKLPPDGF